MDGTRSSENESLVGDMSYLYGRDPSILAYSQRPFPSKESKKNLISLLKEEDEDEFTESDSKVSVGTTESTIAQTVKVFLRMKPFPRKMKITQEQEEAYSIVNSTTLVTKMPSLDNNTSCLKKIKSNEVVCRKFIFTQTFGCETTQLELFERAVKPQMNDFLAGRNSVVMSYGTTNSGKTYTLQGTPENPGIIPRGIEFVFSNIKPRLAPCFKAVNLCDIIYLSQQERIQEKEIKLKLLAFNPTDKIYHIDSYNKMQQLLHLESPMKSNCAPAAFYSVWISFAEIYNETIYDLLWNECQKKRPALKLASDSKGRAFIKGLKSICVNSGVEAYQVLMAGQYNLKVAATALNSRSSRSHCIFTIKLLKYNSEHDTDYVDVSMFTFCDLAGSERLKKTLNVGERLKEAQNINTSLLVLGRCLKTIYESQSSIKPKTDSIGPFRESKLTRLFQRALSGKEHMSLIVNVNPVPNLYVETQNVLNFSAIAKKIEIERIETVKRRQSNSKFSRLVTQSMKTDMDWENTDLVDMTEAPEEYSDQESDIEENDDEIYEDLLMENEILKKEVKELKASALKRDMQTRQEMADTYSKVMKQLEEDWKNRMLDMEEQHEDLRDLAIKRVEVFYKEKLSQLNTRKRKYNSDSEDDEEQDPKLLDELEIANNRLHAKIETMKKTIRDLKIMKDNLESEKNKISFDLAVAIEDTKRTNEKLLAAEKSLETGDDASVNYIEELKSIIKLKDDRIATMKTFLNEAKEEYIFITSEAQQLEKQLKAKEELLVESTEQIHDLEEQISQANVYSSAQNKLLENLEEELEQQMKKLIESEEKVKSLTEQLMTISSDNNKQNKESCNQDLVNEDLEKTKLLLKEMQQKFEAAEGKNNELTEQMNQKDNEIQVLKYNLDSTKYQLDKITESVGSLSIKESKTTEEPKETIEQEMQTDTPIKIVPNNANISCQTVAIETPHVKTKEKSLQTSFFFDLPDETHIVKNATIKTETNTEEFNNLQTQYDELQKLLEFCKCEKEQVECELKQTVSNLENQLTGLAYENKQKCELLLKFEKELENIKQKLDEEKKALKIIKEDQDYKEKEFIRQINETLSREQDKEKEISSLQKEMKNLIQSNETTVKKMEMEMKIVLKDLASLNEQLTKSDEKCKKLDKDYRNVVHFLETRIETLELQIKEKSVENDKLKFKQEELKNALSQSEHELEVFTRNRNETVSKYEDLVKTQHEESERQTKEITRLQDLIQELKENAMQKSSTKSSTKKTRCNVREERKKAKAELTENTSEDDQPDTNRTKPKKEFLTPTKENIPVIELSGSERSTKSATKEQPSSTRRIRRKKLFTPLDDPYVEVDQSEPSPILSTRNLRNRRK